MQVKLNIFILLLDDSCRFYQKKNHKTKFVITAPVKALEPA